MWCKTPFFVTFDPGATSGAGARLFLVVCDQNGQALQWFRVKRGTQKRHYPLILVTLRVSALARCSLGLILCVKGTGCVE